MNTKRLSCILLVLLMLCSLALPAAAAGTSTYTDKSSGTKLTYPSDWDLILQTNDLSKAKFVASGSSVPMLYGCTDLWNNLTAARKKTLPRKDLNNDYFSKADIAELLSCDTGDVKLVSINDQDFFRAEVEKSGTSSGLKYTMTITQWVHVENGWFYLFQFGGNKNHSLYKSFLSVMGSAVFGGSGSTSSGSSTGSSGGSSDAATYKSAVSAYNSGRYSEAQRLFNSVSSYQDSSKYLRLIRIRNAGSNPGMGGAVYSSSCGLTASDRSDIDAAARDFYFADTAEVLLCNSDVACYYLLGKWNGGAKCYIEFFTDKKAGCSYYIGSKLSTNYSSTYSIHNGELRVDILGSNPLTLTMTLTAPNCMEVISHEKGNCYTLTRK